MTTANSAKKALVSLSESTFDLLISDLGMPEIDGYELMRQIRNPKSPNTTIPAIALSAYAADTDRKQAWDAGFQEHIAKPLDVNILISEAISLSKSFKP